jgi:hypothetical protein
MDRFTRNYWDHLRTSPQALIIASLVIVALFLILLAAYTALDLGPVLPKRRP